MITLKKYSHNNILFHVFLILFSLIGGLSILIATSSYELGCFSDGVYYLEAVNNLLNNNGFSLMSPEGNLILLSHWPPFYPLFIFLFTKITGLQTLITVKYLSAILFIVNIFLAGLIFRKFSKSIIFSLIYLLFFLTSYANTIHLIIWSESLFIFILLLGIYLFLKYIKKPNLISLTLCGLIFSFLPLTRYAGIAFIFGIILFLLLEKKNINVKLKNILLFSFISLAPVFIWLINNFLNLEKLANRNISINLISLNHIQQLIITINNWIFPFNNQPFLLYLFIAVIVSLTLFNFKTFKSIIAEHNYKLLIILICSYIIFLFFSISFLDYYTPLDNRILSVIYPLLLIIVLIVIKKMLVYYKINNFIFFPLLIMIILHSASYLIIIKNFNNGGGGFTGKIWQNSEIIKEINKNHKDRIIYSNGVDVLKFLSNKHISNLSFPHKSFRMTNKTNKNYAKEMNELVNKKNSDDITIIFFDNLSWRYYYPSREDLEINFNLSEKKEFKDGIIY